MPPRDDELPEGTDHIINGAMETGAGTGAGGGDEATGGGGVGSGFIGASGSDGTGGTAKGGGTKMTATEGTGTGTTDAGTGSGTGGVSEQLRGQIYNLRDQAGGKVRSFAEDGKTRASDVLEELSRVVADTADSIDERLGNNYGEYARKAADSVSSLAENLRSRDVDELYDNIRSAVRKSPGVAIGIAAVVGFTLVRLVKAGLPEEGGTDTHGSRRTNSGGTGA